MQPFLAQQDEIAFLRAYIEERQMELALAADHQPRERGVHDIPIIAGPTSLPDASSSEDERQTDWELMSFGIEEPVQTPLSTVDSPSPSTVYSPSPSTADNVGGGSADGRFREAEFSMALDAFSQDIMELINTEGVEPDGVNVQHVDPSILPALFQVYNGDARAAYNMLKDHVKWGFRM